MLWDVATEITVKMEKEIWRISGTPQSKHIVLFADAFAVQGKDLMRSIYIARDSIFATLSEKPAVTVIIKGRKTNDASIKGETFSTSIIDEAHVIHTSELFIEEGIQSSGKEIIEDIVKDILDKFTKYLCKRA